MAVEQSKEELVDLVDETGQIKMREVPRSKSKDFPDLYMQIVLVVLRNNLGDIFVHQRSLQKESEPGLLDHVCGAMQSGEEPLAATLREAIEECGLTPTDLEIIEHKVNVYKRYRYLVVGVIDGTPQHDPNESEWGKFISIEDLYRMQEAAEFGFTDSFFGDLELAMQQK